MVDVLARLSFVVLMALNGFGHDFLSPMRKQ